MRIITILFILIFLLSCNSSSNYCTNPVQQFTSIQEAEDIISESKFTYDYELRTPQSSWVRKAVYKSCDKQTGYLLYFTDKNNSYLHKNVPIEVWEGFKTANSKGNYINDYVKGRYRFSL